MKDSDIEFSVGLDISPTEQKLNEIQNRAKQLQTQLSASRGPSITNNLDKQETKLSKIEQQLQALMQGDPKNLTATKLNSLQKRLDTVMKNLSKDNKLIKPAVKSKDFITDNVGKKKENEKETEESLTDQLKKQGKEHSNNLALLSKKLLTLYAIKKVVDAIVGAWKGFGNLTTSRFNNIKQDNAFFSADPVGALRANTDKTRALLYAGIRNLGANSPISASAIDEMSSKFTDIWTSSVSGRGVDKQTAIDIDRLKRYFGIDLSAESLLTGQRQGKTATDLMIDSMDKVEKGIGSLEKLTEVELGQVVDSIKNVFGRELSDALVFNYNQNKLRDDKLLLSEKLKNAGGSAVYFGNLSDTTDKTVTSLSRFKSATETLKNHLADKFLPTFTAVTNKLSDFIDWITTKLNKDKAEQRGISGEAKYGVSIGAYKDENIRKNYLYMANASKEEAKRNASLVTNNQKIAGDLYKKAEEAYRKENKSLAAEYAYKAFFTSQPEYRGEGLASIEGMVAQQQLTSAFKILSSGKSGVYSNPFYNEIANTVGLKDLILEEIQKEFGTSAYDEALSALSGNKNAVHGMQLVLSSKAFGNISRKYFAKGGIFDVNRETQWIPYTLGAQNFLSVQEQLDVIHNLMKGFERNKDYAYTLDYDLKDRNKNGTIEPNEVIVWIKSKDGDFKVPIDLSKSDTKTVTLEDIQ